MWIVTGHCGEYSDHEQWFVAAYDDKAAAERHCVLAESRSKELAIALKALDDSYPEPKYRKREDERSAKSFLPVNRDYNAEARARDELVARYTDYDPAGRRSTIYGTPWYDVDEVATRGPHIDAAQARGE